MEFELWWLLAFPLFFSLGWLAARIDLKHLLLASRALPASYFKGLNFLLNEQPDKAIEAFVEVVKTDPRTIELHFALGSLFRRQGEVDRAIRMHQTLLERPDLGQEFKETALYELAQDFLKAGLLDRAEALFAQLKETRYARAAGKYLLEIYEQEREWLKAIDTAQQLSDVSYSFQLEVAQFYCELAQTEMANSRLDQAEQHLNLALQTHRKCVRANMMLGDLAQVKGEHEQAIQAWKRIENQNPLYLGLIAKKILSAYEALTRAEEGLVLLKGYLTAYPSFDLLEVVVEAVSAQQDVETARQFLHTEVKQSPTLLGLDKLLEFELLTAPVERRPDIELMRSLVHDQTEYLAKYVCNRCGFKARQFYWHCLACTGWETYSPCRGEQPALR